MLVPYNREAAVSYARKWAMARNPNYYNYHNLGGDCTNFVSQCLLAGGGVMNHERDNGWYYYGPNAHSPSWTGVTFLHRFLTRKGGAGPIGHEVPMSEAEIGDLTQFAEDEGRFSHTQIIVSAGYPRSLEKILIAAHTVDSLDRPLSTYKFKKIRFIRIDGIVKD
jgi:hypothetical protein